MSHNKRKYRKYDSSQDAFLKLVEDLQMALHYLPTVEDLFEGFGMPHRTTYNKLKKRKEAKEGKSQR